MRHIIFETNEQYSFALLCKSSAFLQYELERHYYAPLVKAGVCSDDVIAFTLEYNEAGKAPVKHIKAYLDTLMPVLKEQGVHYLYVADANYFKVLAKVSKADPHWGYVLPCKYPGYEDMFVVLGLNYQAMIYNPDLQTKLNSSLDALVSHYNGTYEDPGTGIIHSAQYPQTPQEIAQALESLHQYPSLTCDIETFSLRFNEAGIGTIAFAWDEHNGIAFACDHYPVWEAEGKLSSNPSVKQVDIAALHGFYDHNHEVRALIKKFLQDYKGTLTWHNCTYDIKCIIASLWMEHLLDQKGLLTGLEVMTRSFDDTKIIAYLATNSTAGNVLGLKALAHEFAGNWAQDEIKDIRKIPLPELLQYNLVDALSTWYVKKKFHPIMVKDQQEQLYESLMLPSAKLIIQMELTGMPMDRTVVQRNFEKLSADRQALMDKIQSNPLIQTMNLMVQQSAMETTNAKLKVKQHPIEHFADKRFNPNSDPQMQRLLYELMCLPVIDLTPSKQPSVSGKTIKKLMDHEAAQPYLELLQDLRSFSDHNTLLNTFFPAFLKGVDKEDGASYLHGSFNIGGTVSGRLSSSDPNMQNIPAGSKLAKYVKECFVAPDGWIFGGADFMSLEDMINALLTKDKNKLKVYTDGYDGHSLRAFAYFGDEMPDIEDTVESINSIEHKYPDKRQLSKAPTFALTYGGTFYTMVKNLGWSEEKAKTVEANYQKLYKTSVEWVQSKIAEAAKQGYAEVAFGLRVRVPLLKQVMWGSNHVPYEAQAEARTLGNAVSGQSYGLLNNRAAVAFFNKVWASKYRYDILPVSLIHDAIYILIRDDVEVVAWANKHLTEAMAWQELPEIAHPEVKLGAELDLFYPNWANPITLPNNADTQTIRELCAQALQAA